MKESDITAKEFELIRHIGENGNANQRSLAVQAGMSLGLTNLIIKRLVGKGHLKLRQLTPKKIQYILTPKGMAEKARKSYYFTRRTIDSLRDMRMRIQDAVLSERRGGARSFVIVGTGDLATLVEIALRDMKLDDVKYTVADGLDKVHGNGDTILLAEEASGPQAAARQSGSSKTGKRMINVLEVLAS